MADIRELILERLKAICIAEQTDAGLVSAFRNRPPAKTDLRPLALILDGDERGRDLQPGKNGRELPFRPQRCILSPELWIVLEESKPDATDKGTRLNNIRTKLCAAIAADATLITLLGQPSDIIYRGCVTDLKSGSSLEGQMRLDFDFCYIFDPAT